ncbi:hypothetical protein ABFA07_021940 [Porites harrisoni]
MTRRRLRVRWTLAYRQEMVEKSTLSPQDKVKNKCTLTVGKCRGVYVLRGKRGKRSRRNIEWPTRKAHQTTSVGENWVKEH